LLGFDVSFLESATAVSKADDMVVDRMPMRIWWVLLGGWLLGFFVSFVFAWMQWARGWSTETDLDGIGFVYFKIVQVGRSSWIVGV
jgi:hypothetical protein